MLNQSEPNVILTAHATKVNRPESNWTEPQTCLAGRNHALTCSRLVKLRTEFLLCHVKLVYPEGAKGVQPPLNVFNCVFAQKYCTSFAPVFIISWILYRKTLRIAHVYTLISHFVSEFASFCFVPHPWLGPLLENSWSITCELPPL